MSLDTASPLHKQILVVDDDPAFLSIATATLMRAQLAYEVVTTGAQALRHLRLRQYQAVLLDLMLPDIDGIEVLRRARETLDPPPIILISGAGTITSAVSAMKLGAQDFLEKPIDMSDMLDTINSALLGIDGQAHQPDSAVIADLATLIVLVARADQDVKRIVDWAKLASIAPQTIFTRCSRAGITAKQALDLGRLLRICGQDEATRSPAQMLESVDGRMIAALANRAGFQLGELGRISQKDFLHRQALLVRAPLVDCVSRMLET